MINFRYHVVSLTAVFLALAIGLVVGTAALNGTVADSLNDTVNALRKDNQQLRETVGQLQEDVTKEEDFATDAAGYILASRLTGRRILVATMPTGQDYADGVAKMLETAGAKITGRVNIQDKLANPENSVELLELADKISAPSLPTAELPGNVDGIETSSAVLAAVLLDHAPAVTAADRTEVLTAYGEAGYVSVAGTLTGPAEAVVLVTGAPYIERDSAKRNEAVVTIATQLDKAAVLVVAGTGVGEGNVISEIRGDPTLNKTISTVDNASTSQGQVVTALATAEQIVLTKVGQYGLATGATTLMPKQAA